MKKLLTSKERVLVSFARQEPDHVPVNYFSNPGIDGRLKKHFGLRAGDDEGLRRALGVDFRSVDVPYLGPQLFDDLPGRQVDIMGVHRQWIENPHGGYWDYVDFPLKDAALAEIEAWPMPDPDHFDYGNVAAQCREWQQYCLVVGNAGLGDFINSTGFLRSMEQVLIDLITDEPACLAYFDKKLAFQLALTERILDAAGGRIDLLWMGEDLGTQRGPLISKALYRKHIRPRHQRVVDLAKAYDLPVVIHSCGSSSWAFDDFIEMGISVVDTLQPEVKEMAPAYLKATYGDRLAFHGCISTAGPVAYGTVAETVENVRQTLATMMPGGGYALSPTHQLQDNSPTENVIAMYEAAQRHGWY
ncbi:MAG: uroporphyrinogen decarboxylase family protein [Chloroflexota bacterium]|nr:uroporphyrinogen decarboxylase family protein [Chloroflexota bacterium]